MKSRIVKACLCLLLSFSLLGGNVVTYAEETNDILDIQNIDDDDESLVCLGATLLRMLRILMILLP